MVSQHDTGTNMPTMTQNFVNLPVVLLSHDDFSNSILPKDNALIAGTEFAKKVYRRLES